MRLHKLYGIEECLKKRCKHRTNRALASFYSIGYYRNRFQRIKALGKSHTTAKNMQPVETESDDARRSVYSENEAQPDIS